MSGKRKCQFICNLYVSQLNSHWNMHVLAFSDISVPGSTEDTSPSYEIEEIPISNTACKYYWHVQSFNKEHHVPWI